MLEKNCFTYRKNNVLLYVLFISCSIMFYADKNSSTGSSSRKLTMRRLSFSVLIFACARRAANTAQSW